MINHCNRRITLLSDSDISFGLFILFTYFYMPFEFWVIVSNTEVVEIFLYDPFQLSLWSQDPIFHNHIIKSWWVLSFCQYIWYHAYGTHLLLLLYFSELFFDLEVVKAVHYCQEIIERDHIKKFQLLL
jgi:hypothetical protein